ncbi:hypothetical protein K0040_17005 [Terrisporobacter petrolearius]|uniref:DUF6530 family protein n=1 Tax=Terrisporobacter petrolearius TaxID=1460447 RepID=UPI001D169796|nr:DUF6530 family protein [Terrisporobacter petrolearius]MCC3865957.1 hypothetical protein [Terrisporobacter petrolearius]
MEFKPVIRCDNYKKVDGFRAPNSDMEKVDLGVKENEDNKRLEIITKLLKLGGGFEEIPVNRILDMAILLCEASLYLKEAYRMPKLYDENNLTISRVGLQGDAMNISICKDNKNLDEDIITLANEFNKQGELLGERFKVLAEILEELGY